MPPTLRQTEALLRAAGMSAAAAKRIAPQRLAAMATLSPEGTSTMPFPAPAPAPAKPSATNLTRALQRFAPDYERVVDTGSDRSARPVTVAELLRARAAIAEGPELDAETFDADLELARSALAEIDQLIADRRAAQAREAAAAQPVDGQDMDAIARHARGHRSSAPQATGPAFRNVDTGQVIRAFRGSERLAPAQHDDPTYGLGDLVRAHVTGDWSAIPAETRANMAGLGAGGGFLVPPDFAPTVIDLARHKARVMQAGAMTMPMPRGTLTIATIDSDPKPAWRGELMPFATSQGSYGQIVLSTKVLGVLVPLSIELVESAANINDLVLGQVTEQMALMLDAAAMAGAGTQAQPTGILPKLLSENIIPVGAALDPATAYSKWGTAIGRCLAANAELANLSVLHNSDVEVALDNLVDTQHQPLRPSPNYASIRDRGAVYTANGIATEGDPASTYSLIGDFSQVLFGMQQNLQLEVSKTGGYVASQAVDLPLGQSIAVGDQVDAFSRGMYLIRAMMMVDVAIIRPSFFSQVADIRFA